MKFKNRTTGEIIDFNPININSTLVSAQQRNRHYWANWVMTRPDDKNLKVSDILDLTVDYNTVKTTDKTLTNITKHNYHRMTKDGNNLFISNTMRDASIYNIDDCKSTCMVSAMGIGGGHVPMILNKKLFLERIEKAIVDKDDMFDKCIEKGHTIGEELNITPVESIYGDNVLRKLSPLECERLQTLDDEYTLMGINDKGETVKVANTYRYHAIGNGWTVDVIAHLFKGT